MNKKYVNGFGLFIVGFAQGLNWMLILTIIGLLMATWPGDE